MTAEEVEAEGRELAIELVTAFIDWKATGGSEALLEHVNGQLERLPPEDAFPITSVMLRRLAATLMEVLEIQAGIYGATAAELWRRIALVECGGSIPG